MSKYIGLDDCVDVLQGFTEATPTGKTAQDLVKALPTIEVSGDCISRENLLKHAYKREGVLSVSVDSIKLAPSVVPSRAEGEWITEEGSYEIICSNCEYGAFDKDGEWFKTDYCPNCGAKMRLE